MGWRFHGRKRTKVAPFTTINWKPFSALLALLDGPGGKRLRDAFTSTTLGGRRLKWNSRTRRTTVDTPGFGYLTRQGRRRAREDREDGAPRRFNWRGALIVVGLLVVAVWITLDVWVIPFLEGMTR